MLEALIDNFISENEVDYLTKKYATMLYYGDKSHESIDTHGHWSYKPFRLNRNIIQNLPYDITQFRAFQRDYPDFCALWKRIKEYLPDNGKDRGVSRVYVNGYTYGTDAYIHRDDAWVSEKYFEKSETCMIYLNKEWDYNWGGETVLINDETKEIDYSVLPKMGRLIVFDSNALHGARPLSRLCNNLRLIMVFKAMNTNLNHPGIEYLIKNKFDEKGFENKSLLEYLHNMTNYAVNTYKCDSGVMNCIMFHNIYNLPSIVQPEREEIRSLIGDQSEEVIWEYSKFNLDTKSILDSNESLMKPYHLMMELVRLENTDPNNQYLAEIKQKVEDRKYGTYGDTD